MATLGAYTLDLEPEQKRVFVTQIRDEDEEIPVEEEAKKGKGNFLETGKNTLQKTLLLKREVEIDKVQYELDQKRKEFEKRMEECHYMKEDLKLKQKIIKERILKFDKFVKENEAKRKRAIMKYQEEVKIKENKSKELFRLQNELSQYLLRHQKLKERLKSYYIFEKYLNQVLDSLPEGYLESTDNMLTSLMMRFRTLSSTNNTLVERLTRCSDEVERGQRKIQELNESHMQNLLVFNSELASTQKLLEGRRAKNMKLEQIYNSERLNFRQQMQGKISGCFQNSTSVVLQHFQNKTETLGQIMIAIDNIADRCSRRPKEIEAMSYHEKLDVIKDYMTEREDILSLVRYTVGSAASGPNEKGKDKKKEKRKTEKMR